ncbi:MAG: fmt, partial [Pseudomonas sp.]|nr:fmt [Pseudomonas sp.]
ERLVRAFNPWPICHSTLNGEALKVLAASLDPQQEPAQGQPGEILSASKDGLIVACGQQALRLTRLQLPGGKALNFTDLFNSRREKFAVGSILGAEVSAQ